MEELIHKFLIDNYFFELSTFSSFYLKEIQSNNKLNFKELKDKLCIIFGYDFDTDNELVDVYTKWSTKEISDIHRKINHIKYQLFSSGKSDVVSVEEMNQLIKEFKL